MIAVEGPEFIRRDSHYIKNISSLIGWIRRHDVDADSKAVW